MEKFREKWDGTNLRIAATIDEIELRKVFNNQNGKVVPIVVVTVRPPGGIARFIFRDVSDQEKIASMDRGGKLTIDAKLRLFAVGRGHFYFYPLEVDNCRLADELADKRKNRLKELNKQPEEEGKGKAKKRLVEEEEEPKK